MEITVRTAELIVQDALKHLGEYAQVLTVCPDDLNESFVVTLGRANREVPFFLKQSDCQVYPTTSGEKVRAAVHRALQRLPK